MSLLFAKINSLSDDQMTLKKRMIHVIDNIIKEMEEQLKLSKYKEKCSKKSISQKRSFLHKFMNTNMLIEQDDSTKSTKATAIFGNSDIIPQFTVSVKVKCSKEDEKIYNRSFGVKLARIKLIQKIYLKIASILCQLGRKKCRTAMLFNKDIDALNKRFFGSNKAKKDEKPKEVKKVSKQSKKRVIKPVNKKTVVSKKVKK